ncbi:Eukaryotic initiation factor 3 [Macleaya cordata]|uniref:tRNA (adenine(58)-N(1))-methyltransferase non-catalytic subunit TRM6 n=1 Tax=Macleaya cordata TaxID=56857 RepID=A0A200R779_MACCD|nr:Eukaryotic initiation factor 3 [Macleaya cordata]
MAEGGLQINSNQNPRVTWEGCSVLLDINDGDRLVFARLSPASTLKIGDKKCLLQPLIGCPFGSLFQVETGSKGPYLSRILAATAGDIQQEKVEFQLKEEPKDNRALVDDNTAQNLSGEDIDEMRRQGASGDQIIEALIANSSTFGKKTLFSQEKYRLRKQKKYAPRVLLRRPFARSISEAYFKKYPARIGFLRTDVLSLLLSMANVSSYSDVLVVDMVGGILTGAVAERLGGTGYVCNTYFGVTPYPMDIVGIFNFNNEICSRIIRFPLSELSLAKNNNSEQPEQEENAMSLEFQLNADEAALSTTCVSSSGSLSISEEQINQQETPDLCSDSVNNKEAAPLPQNLMSSMHVSMDGIDASSVTKACKSTKPGKKATQEAINSWKQNGFSSLIIAAPELDPWTVAQELLPHLSYSAPFAIYHQYLQPLATCMHNLQTARMAIGLQISEPWLREYQVVLPSRTHPCMQMSGFGGYILSGIRICSSEIEQQTK